LSIADGLVLTGLLMNATDFCHKTPGRCRGKNTERRQSGIWQEIRRAEKALRIFLVTSSNFWTSVRRRALLVVKQ